MVSYPSLSTRQQRKLPELIQSWLIPAMYDDSTHQLWDCDTKQGSIILKICNSNNVADSDFWQGMSSLFGVDLPSQLDEFESVFNKLTEFSPLAIPKYITASSATQDDSAFIAVKKIAGTMVTAEHINDGMVATLAQHIANLHQQTQTAWGRIDQTNFNPQQWPQRLQKTLKLLADKQGNIPTDLLDEAIKLSGKLKVKQFVPIMPDLRWDQFLQHNGKLSALVDLDALVIGPRELELVLLEYLLDAEQSKIFANHYQQTHTLPELSQTRKPYRLLLFMMNVLGEKNLNVWMHAATRF